MSRRDPQGLALAPTVDPLVDVMCWLVDPDGGALRMDQAIDIARAIARGGVPNVGMMHSSKEPFAPLTAHMVTPCGTKISIYADHFDMCHVTNALAAAGWVVTLIQEDN